MLSKILLLLYLKMMGECYWRRWCYWSRDKWLLVLYRSIIPSSQATRWKQNKLGTCSRIQWLKILSNQFNLGRRYYLRCHWRFVQMRIMTISMWVQNIIILQTFHYHHPTDKFSISIINNLNVRSDRMATYLIKKSSVYLSKWAVLALLLNFDMGLISRTMWVQSVFSYPNC